MIRYTARAIVIKDDQMLLMERWRDGLHYFSIPGGGIEDGETAEQAAVRELAEEMSVIIEPVRVLYKIHAPDAEHTIFLAAYKSGEAALHPDSPEAREQTNTTNHYKPRWMPIARLAELPFVYWEPLQAQLVHDATVGFPDKAVDITYQDSVQ